MSRDLLWCTHDPAVVPGSGWHLRNSLCPLKQSISHGLMGNPHFACAHGGIINCFHGEQLKPPLGLEVQGKVEDLGSWLVQHEHVSVLCACSHDRQELGGAHARRHWRAGPLPCLVCMHSVHSSCCTSGLSFAYQEHRTTRPERRGQHSFQVFLTGLRIPLS